MHTNKPTNRKRAYIQDLFESGIANFQPLGLILDGESYSGRVPSGAPYSKNNGPIQETLVRKRRLAVRPAAAPASRMGGKLISSAKGRIVLGAPTGLGEVRYRNGHVGLLNDPPGTTLHERMRGGGEERGPPDRRYLRRQRRQHNKHPSRNGA